MENYFELYEIPVSFRPDAAIVKQKFYALSKQFHPDRFAQAEDNAKSEALRKAALNNEAYKIFGNADRTMAYVLRLKNLLQEEEKYDLPPAFLMEMMDLNEVISDSEDDPGNESVKTQAKQALAAQLQAWETLVDPLIRSFEQGDDQEALLIKIKDFYFRRKYLLRISERLTTFASR